MVYNPEKHKFGSVCKRGHHFFLFDINLRYRKSNVCVDCSKAHVYKYRKDNKLEYNKYCRGYYNRNKDKFIESKRKWRKKNPEKFKAQIERHNEKFATKLYQKEYQRGYYRKTCGIYTSKIYGKKFHKDCFRNLKQTLLQKLSWKVFKKEENGIIYISRKNNRRFLEVKIGNYVEISKPYYS